MAALTSMLVYAMPLLSLPVLFSEISNDLGLSLLQIGFIWGATSLAAILTSIPLGALGDRFGPRRTLSIACLAVGILGALRAYSFDYATFLLTVLLHGLITPAIPPNLHKTAAAWFPGQRGLSSGIISAGFALGLALGSAVSASLLSPWLGGWQNVLILYGSFALIAAPLWYLLDPDPKTAGDAADQPKRIPYVQALRHVGRSRPIWLIGFGTLSFWICYKGFSGYLPLYLREIGWQPQVADQTLTTFFAVSLIGVMPLSLLSDRYNIKKWIIILSVSGISLAVFSFSFATGLLIWGALIVGGFFFDAYMAIHQALALETEGIGAQYAGTALGLIATVREVGGFLGPPIGNALAEFNLAAPFIFWGLAGLAGAFVLARLPNGK